MTLELETQHVGSNNAPVKVKVRVEIVDYLPRETAMLAKGRQVNEQDFRRGPQGEWVDRAGKRVTDPVVVAILEKRGPTVMPMAMFDQESATGYVIRIAKGTPAAAVERALAHELTEIRTSHGETTAPQQHALEPGSKATLLSPHDRGRLAELLVLAKQFSKPNASAIERNQAFDEAQRLAAHLGLTGEGEAALARRSRALDAIGGGAPEELLRSAIGAAAQNPFLQPLTGDLRSDLATLSRRLAMAQKLGELPGDSKTWLPKEAYKRPAPVAAEIAEQIRQMLIRDKVVILMREQPGVHNPMQTESLLRDLPPEMQVVFDFALAKAKIPGGHHESILDQELDPNTIAATRARFADFDNFDDWPAFKAKYLAENPSLADKANPGEFVDPIPMRKAFDRWTRGRYMPEGSSASRSLLTESLAPDRGYEAQFLKNPAALEGLALAEQMKLAENEEPIPTDEVAEKRNNLLKEAETKREDADRIEKLGDIDAADTLRTQADDLVQQVRPLSEAFGVLAGQAFAAKEFPGAEVIEMHGSGVPDLVVKRTDGKLVIIECKGGEADLGTRLSADGSRRVQQGTREYLKSLATTMTRSGDPKIASLGGQLLLQVDDPTFNQEYYLVKQQFDGRKPLPPKVGQFDISNRVRIAPTTAESSPTAAEVSTSPDTKVQVGMAGEALSKVEVQSPELEEPARQRIHTESVVMPSSLENARPGPGQTSSVQPGTVQTGHEVQVRVELQPSIKVPEEHEYIGYIGEENEGMSTEGDERARKLILKRDE
jgi:hypothetical protein